MPADVTDQLSQDLASLKIDRSAKPRRSMAGLVIITLVVLGIGAIGVFVVYPKVTGSLFTTEVKTDELRRVSPSQAQIQLSATGYVVALVRANVASKVPGRIAQIFVEEGQKIAKDAPVARLEDVDFKSALAASRAKAAAARARIQIARANLAELKVQIEREKPLVEKGVTAKATLDDLVAKADSLKANVSSAEAEALAADAESKSLEVQLGSYQITTPIAGTVVKKIVEVGEGVAPGFGQPGVVEVVDMDSLVIEVDVPEGRLSQISEGLPAEITLDAYPSTRLAGSVKEIGRRVNRSKATVPVKVKFDDPPDQRRIKAGAEQGKPMMILPEMAGRVSFLSEKIDPKALEIPEKLVAPKRAVVKRNNADVVFVFDDGTVRQVTVTVKGDYAGGLEVETKLPEKSKLVLDPPADLADGTKVKEKK